MSARRTIIAVAIALGGLWSCTGGDDRPAVDTILHGGTVFDGTGRPGAVMDVATRGDRIVAVGEDLRTRYRATEEIDVGGQVVAPGFIDPHTHAIEDVENLAEPQPLVHYLTQGVSTLVIGNDGRGGADVSRTLEKLEGLGVGPNVAVFVGHNALRIAAMGMVDRAPTAEELDQMTHDVDRAMAEGALGLSAGLYYTPGVYATTEEVTALARVAARYGGLYESHIRDESTYSIGLLEAIDEALTIGRDSGAAVHIAHIKALGVDVWGQSEAVVTRINDARDAGQSVTADQYPWRASGTRLTNALLPGWVRAGGTDAMVERLRDNTVWTRLLDHMRENLRRRGGARAILLTSGEHAGHTLHDVAATRGEAPVDAALALILAGDARIASFNMHEDDIARFMTQPWVVTSSDGSTGHPRKYASFPQKYREYVADQRILSLAEFVAGSTSRTADILKLCDRGRLAPGKAADIVVFDPDRFAPRADFRAPERLSVGVQHLMINGRWALRDAQPTGQQDGRGLKRGDCDTHPGEAT